MNFIYQRPLLTIVVSYLLWALSYPPFILGPFACIVLVPALMVTIRLNRKKAIWYNFFGGLLHNLIMYYWIFNVMKVGPPFIIGFGVFLLISYLSLYYAYMAWMAKIFQDKKWGWAGYALIWVGIEMIRTVGQISFPWSHIGYTWGPYLPLIQIASIIGVFGISFLIIAFNFKIAQDLPQKNYRSLAILGCTLVLLLGFGYAQLHWFSEGQQHASMDISMVQPSIEQTKKWDEAYFNGVIEKTVNLMDTSNIKGSDLIILAETAIPAFLARRPEVALDFKRRAKELQSHIIVGSLDYEYNKHPAKPYNFFNSAFLFTSDSAKKETAQYSKIRLVPFSERLPFENIFPIINYVNLGEGDFSPGGGYKVWGKKTPYSPSICYEIVYPDYVRAVIKKGAKFLVNITNDGWFGRSPAPYQHANISRFRAVESGIAIARCSNSGVSVFYDSKGRILGKTKLFQETVLRRTLPVTTRNTVYNSIGGFVEGFIFYSFWAFNLWLLVKFIRGRYSASRQKHNP